MNTMNGGNRGGFGGGGGGFSHKAPILATDMRCYFDCPEGFKKDYDLRLHIKLRHKNEDEAELRRAYQACEEEIALVKRTCSVFQCAMCPKQLSESGALADHVKSKHGLQWNEYKDQYGRCEVESAPFECKICGRVIKYDRKIIQVHMKHVHRITWEQYLDRIRKMRKGQMAGDLPDIELFECKICNASVKFIFKGNHLKRVHKITEGEYVELFQDELMNENRSTIPKPPSNMQPMNQPANIPMKTEYDDRFGDGSMMPSNFSSNAGPMSSPQMPNQWRNASYDQSRNNHINNDMNEDYNGMKMQEPDQKFQMMDIKPQISPPFGETSNTSQPQDAPTKFLLKPPKSDIQNSTNKTCSSCNITFETRRKFIEHCTIDHKMKFKTASGAKIAAPPSLQGFQPQHSTNMNNGHNGIFSPGTEQQTLSYNNQNTFGNSMNFSSSMHNESNSPACSNDGLDQNPDKNSKTIDDPSGKNEMLADNTDTNNNLPLM